MKLEGGKHNRPIKEKLNCGTFGFKINMVGVEGSIEINHVLMFISLPELLFKSINIV